MYSTIFIGSDLEWRKVIPLVYSVGSYTSNIVPNYDLSLQYVN